MSNNEWKYNKVKTKPLNLFGSCEGLGWSLSLPWLALVSDTDVWLEFDVFCCTFGWELTLKVLENRFAGGGGGGGGGAGACRVRITS